MVFFEDLVTDMPKMIREIAQFTGYEVKWKPVDNYLDFKLIMFLYRFLMTKLKNLQIIVLLTNSKTMLLLTSNLDSLEKAKSETGKIILSMNQNWKLMKNGLKIVILKISHLLMNKTVQNKVQTLVGRFRTVYNYFR